MPNETRTWKMSEEVRSMIVDVVIPEILKGELEQRDKGKGPYTTTGQQAVPFDLPDGGYGRLSFAVTCFPAERGAKGKAKDDGERRITLKTSELAELDALIAHTTDTSAQLELRTIKGIHSALGYVTLPQFIELDKHLKARG